MSQVTGIAYKDGTSKNGTIIKWYSGTLIKWRVILQWRVLAHPTVRIQINFILQCIKNLGIREGPNVYKSLPMLKATCLVNNYNKIYHRGSCTIKQG